MTLPEKPFSRREQYLSKIAGQDTEIPEEPFSREEMYLDEIARNGGGGGGYVLPIASADELGGVKVGTGLAIDADTGVLSTSGGSGPTVVQTTGTSTTDVMSQNAVTQMVFTSADKTGVRIGAYSGNYGSNSVAIGTSASSGSSNNTTAVGYNARANQIGAVAIGAHSRADAQGEFNIGSTNSSTGYKGTFTRLLTGVHAPENDTDAANKQYVDSKSIRVLTSADFNYPTNNPDGIATWLYTPGIYFIEPGTKFYFNNNTDNTDFLNQGACFIVFNQWNSGTEQEPEINTSCLILSAANAGAVYYTVNGADGGQDVYSTT